MSVTRPGFDNSSGSRNLRRNRYERPDGNNVDNRHKAVADITIGFVAPDQITDTGNRFAQFQIGEVIRVRGSATNDDDREVDIPVAGQIDTIEQTIATEAAGAAVNLSSLNNENVNRFS